MNRTIAWADWTMNVITGLCIFVGGTVVFAPDLIVSPRQEIAEAMKLADDGSLPPMTEQQMWSPEYWATVDKATQ